MRKSDSEPEAGGTGRHGGIGQSLVLWVRWGSQEHQGTIIGPDFSVPALEAHAMPSLETCDGGGTACYR